MPVVCGGEREKLCLYFCVQSWFVRVRNSVTLTEKPFVSRNQVAIFTRSSGVSLRHVESERRHLDSFTNLRVLPAYFAFLHPLVSIIKEEEVEKKGAAF